jgi:hypothetical protein
MARITEVWIDNCSLTARRLGDTLRIVLEGDTYNSNGVPVRHVGPIDITDDLDAQHIADLQIWLDEARARIQTEAEILPEDLLGESPIPPPPS